MEANLLPYVAARISQYGGSLRSNFAMASLLSPSVAVTTRHALPVQMNAPSESKDRVTLEFPQRAELSEIEGKLVQYDGGVDFAVIRLDASLELPTESRLFSTDPAKPGAPWETLCFTSSAPEGKRSSGLVQGFEVVGGRRLLKLSVAESPEDPIGVSGAPVMVDGKIIGIIWGMAEPDEYADAKIESWYAVPIASMIENKPTSWLRGVLEPFLEQESAPHKDDLIAGDSIRAMVGRLADDNSDVRIAAVRALRGTLGSDPQARVAVIGRLADKNTNVRVAAVEALSDVLISDTEVRAAVIGRLADKSYNVRVVAVQALRAVASTDDQVKAAVLERLLKDKSSNVRAVEK